jgi:hypothetical protein
LERKESLKNQVWEGMRRYNFRQYELKSDIRIIWKICPIEEKVRVVQAFFVAASGFFGLGL